MKTTLEITASDREQIATILSRRANEVAMYSNENREGIPASVEFALEREITRLRSLAGKMSQPSHEEEA